MRYVVALMRMKGKVLIVLHQRRSTPGRLGQSLVRRGFALDVRRPALGCTLPETLAGHDGAVIFGGPMSANDPHDFIDSETGWIGVPLREKKPLLGVCLGAQLLARHLGAPVEPHPDGCVEVGYYAITPTKAGQALGPWPSHVYQWHTEGFGLPGGARLLAESELFPNQAFQYGTAFGLQFHPEMTRAMMHRWTVRGAERMKAPCAQERVRHFQGRKHHGHAELLWLEAFLDHWTGLMNGTD